MEFGGGRAGEPIPNHAVTARIRLSSLSRVGVLLTYRGVADPACCDVSSTTIDHLYFTLVYVIPQITNLR